MLQNQNASFGWKSRTHQYLIAFLFSIASICAAADKPNIIVIYTDDQGYGDASCLNPEAKFSTPNLDRLAEEGISFTNAHCADTVCTPSRYGLLTGRYCWRTTRKTGVMNAEGKCLIADGRMTLASMLKSQGYATAMVGKWHLGMDFPGKPGNRDWSQPVKDMPLDKGFDYFFGIPASLNYGILAWFEGRHAAVPPTMFTAKKPNKRHVDYRIMPPYQKTPEQTREVLGKKGMEVATDFIDNQCLTRFTDKAIEWIQKHAEQANSPEDAAPFFLYLPFTSPHYPVCPLPEFWGKGDCGGYGEFMVETDYHVGRLQKHLAESGLDENTIVVFTSDNGPENSWRQRIKKFDHYSSGAYRGGKRDIYEGGHRVPFFVRWPKGIVEPGRTCDSLIGQVDLLATFAEIVGHEVPVNAGEDSQSFATLMEDPKATHARLPIINHGIKGRFAITDGNWKYVAEHGEKSAELYDLAADPGEKKNILEANPAVVDTLKRKMSEIVRNGRTTSGPRQPNDTGYWTDLTWMTAAEYDAATPN